MSYPLGGQQDKQFKNQNWHYDIHTQHRKLFDIPFNQMCKQEDDIYQKKNPAIQDSVDPFNIVRF